MMPAPSVFAATLEHCFEHDQMNWRYEETTTSANPVRTDPALIATASLNTNHQAHRLHEIQPFAAYPHIHRKNTPLGISLIL